MNVIDVPDLAPAAWDAILDAAAGDREARHRAGPLWEVYAPLVERSAVVIGQIGQSLDGRVATSNGHSRYVNGPAALTHLHRLRALVDAVVIGVGTACADDPQLTVRLTRGANPVRVIVDPAGRLPRDAKCLEDDGTRRVVMTTRPHPCAPGIEQVEVAAENGRMSPDAILAALRARGLRRVLIEGGPHTLSAFLAAGALDRLHVMIAPIIIGDGPASLTLPPIAHMSAALRPQTRLFRLGSDLLCDCDLHP